MRNLFLIIASLLLLVSCKNTGKAYDLAMQEAYSCAVETQKLSQDVASMTVTTLTKATFDHVDSHGDRVDNASDALRRLRDDYKANGTLDSLESCKSRLNSLASKLENSPSERKDVYNDFMALVAEINTLCDLATQPSGTPYDYSQKVSHTLLAIDKARNEFLLKYSKQLKTQ